MRNGASNGSKKSFYSLSLASLGVVFGDIGTSPLYALQQTVAGVPINLPNVLGILSLILWSLIFVISIKYLCIVLNADNNGEGGVLALLALIKGTSKRRIQLFFVLGIFATGLMLGDSILTPSISVMSAIEGLKVVEPPLSEWVLPLACVILLLLFTFQSQGTAKIGFAFGPILLVWFSVLGILGIIQIVKNPIVLEAIDPYYGFEFLIRHGLKGYALLGGVFLVMTGGEALYADLGHFGKNPIRLSWFLVVLPCLFLEYFGQAANLLRNPATIRNPFYLMAPHWFLIPLVILATLATVIASQAVITGAFSLAKQAVLLNLYPKLRIIQTSEFKEGQIYVPQVNFVLAVGTIGLILVFRSSAELTHIYGMAVNMVMLLTTLMAAYAAYKIWQWNVVLLSMMFTLFIFIDLLFLGANAHKLLTDGWIPIVFAGLCALVMYSWDRGMRCLRDNFYGKRDDFAQMLKKINRADLHPLPGVTSIFITDIYDKSGGTFLHFLKMARAFPENILLINYQVENIPYVGVKDRFEIACLESNICMLTLHYGFMDFISIPQALRVMIDKKLLPFSLNVEAATYMIEVPNVIASRKRPLLKPFILQKLFTFLMRNYSTNLDIEFYQLPYNRTVAIGAYFVL